MDVDHPFGMHYYTVTTDWWILVESELKSFLVLQSNTCNFSPLLIFYLHYYIEVFTPLGILFFWVWKFIKWCYVDARFFFNRELQNLWEFYPYFLESSSRILAVYYWSKYSETLGFGVECMEDKFIEQVWSIELISKIKCVLFYICSLMIGG